MAYEQLDTTIVFIYLFFYDTTILCPQWRQFQDQEGIVDYVQTLYSNFAAILCNN